MNLGKGSQAKRSGQKKRLPLWALGLFNLLVAILTIALVQAFLVKIFSVPSSSMEPTLFPGNRLVVNRLGYVIGSPNNGDIVVFRAQGTWLSEEQTQEESPLQAVSRSFGDLTGIGPSHSKYLVKRILAEPGDTIECCSAAGNLIRNGQELAEDSLGAQFEFSSPALSCSSEPRSRRCFGPLTVPEGEYFVLGDNRANSADSLGRCGAEERRGQQACLRFVARKDLIGPLWLIF